MSARRPAPLSPIVFLLAAAAAFVLVHGVAVAVVGTPARLGAWPALLAKNLSYAVIAGALAGLMLQDRSARAVALLLAVAIIVLPSLVTLASIAGMTRHRPPVGDGVGLLVHAMARMAYWLVGLLVWRVTVSAFGRRT